MNRLNATITNIENVATLHHLTLRIKEQYLEMLSLELDPLLQIGSPITIHIKSTQIALAKNLQGSISYLNQLHATVKEITQGKIVSSIEIDLDGVTLESLMLTKSLLALNLTQGESILLLIKESEISIC